MSVVTLGTAPAAAAIAPLVDLRAFAADAAAGTPADAGGDAWFAARRLLPVPPGVVTIAALTPEATEGMVAALAADEFVFVLSGGLTILTDAPLVLRADQSAVLPAGLGFSWRAEPGTQAIVMTCDSGAPGAAAPVRIDLGAALAPSNPPVAELLVGDTPACRNHTDYLSASGEFMAGTWDATPYHRRAIDYAHYELMHLLSGSVTFADDAGHGRLFREGDLFVVLQGARVAWISEEPCAKLYVIYRPKA